MMKLIVWSVCCGVAAVEGYDYQRQGLDWKGVCATGTMQSPVNIGNVQSADDTFEYRFDGNMTNFRVFHTDHSIEVEVEEGHHLLYGGMEYTLQQYHFHSNAEHLFNGKRRQLELHAVHATDANALAVVSFSYEADANAKEDELLKKVMSVGDIQPGFSQEVRCAQAEVPCLDIQYTFGTKSTSSFVTYEGSLTTPPCTEGVLWFVERKDRPITVEQANWFLTRQSQSSVAGNYREIRTGMHPDLLVKTITPDYYSPTSGAMCIKTTPHRVAMALTAVLVLIPLL